MKKRMQEPEWVTLIILAKSSQGEVLISRHVLDTAHQSIDIPQTEY
jgi:hypothetical protein